MHSALLVYQDLDHRDFNNAVAIMCGLVRAWLGQPAKRLKDLEVAQFHVDVACGGWLDHCNLTFGLLFDMSAWEKMGMPAGVGGAMGKPSAVQLDIQMRGAKVVVKLAFGLVRARVCRACSYSHGLPHCFASLLSERVVERDRALDYLRRVDEAA